MPIYCQVSACPLYTVPCPTLACPILPVPVPDPALLCPTLTYRTLPYSTVLYSPWSSPPFPPSPPTLPYPNAERAYPPCCRCATSCTFVHDIFDRPDSRLWVGTDSGVVRLWETFGMSIEGRWRVSQHPVTSIEQHPGDRVGRR